MTQTSILVSSHVARDLLSSAAAFKNEAAAVWEYIANSIEYVDPGVSPIVQVAVDAHEKTIRISDNGRGMGVTDLSHFFFLHAENRDRLAGRPGRGKFGTGKSAAFGIGKRLTIESFREGKRNVVELSREQMDKSSGQDFPVVHLVCDEDVDQPNGTSITISEIFLPKLRTNEIIEYIERNLQAYRAQQPLVAVNDHVCEYRPPEVVHSEVFRPTPAQAAIIGNCELTIRVARIPLSDAEQGILVTSGVGNLVGREDCGVSRKEFGNYLFGEVDVPALESFSSPMLPYDDSRSLKLNLEHPVVRVLLTFLGPSLEKVRQQQVRASREAKKTEEMRRLSREANSIAQLLNDDFQKLRDRLDQIRSASASRGPARSIFGSRGEEGSTPESWARGTQERGVIDSPKAPPGKGQGRGRESPSISATGKPDSSGQESVDPIGGPGRRKSAQGGFEVSYEYLGKDEERSIYDRTRLAILINLEHPAVANALRVSGVEDPVFRRLSYEIAFSEYAMALGYLLVQQDPDMPADDLLFEVRATLNRLARAAAHLYAN